MRLRHMIKIILFLWILHRFFFSLDSRKVFQLDFKIAFIKANLQNALMQVETNKPMQQKKETQTRTQL